MFMALRLNHFGGFFCGDEDRRNKKKHQKNTEKIPKQSKVKGRILVGKQG